MTIQTDTLITVTSGKQDRGTRATLAFAWGCAALAMGQTVTVYLTMDGTVWAMQGALKDVTVAGFEPLGEYMEQFLALGGELLVCAPCTEYYCSFNGNTGGASLIEGAQITGLATIVSKTGPGTRLIAF